MSVGEEIDEWRPGDHALHQRGTRKVTGSMQRLFGSSIRGIDLVQTQRLFQDVFNDRLLGFRQAVRLRVRALCVAFPQRVEPEPVRSIWSLKYAQ